MNRRTLLKVNIFAVNTAESWLQIYHLQAYGIKFIITVDGLARKFSLKNTVLNVGNGLALLGITTVLCELVLMYFIKVGYSLLCLLVTLSMGVFFERNTHTKYYTR